MGRHSGENSFYRVNDPWIQGMRVPRKSRGLLWRRGVFCVRSATHRPESVMRTHNPFCERVEKHDIGLCNLLETCMAVISQFIDD